MFSIFGMIAVVRNTLNSPKWKVPSHLFAQQFGRILIYH